MKFESLNSSKFNVFKEDAVKNPLMVQGGRVDRTFYIDIQTSHDGKDQWVTGADVPSQSTAGYASIWQEVGEFIFLSDPNVHSGDTLEASSTYFSTTQSFIAP